MVCAKCGADVDTGRLLFRKDRIAGIACHGCAWSIETNRRNEGMAKKNGQKKGANKPAAAKKKAAKPQGGKKAAAKPQGAKKEGSLAAIIDPMLTTGGHTVAEIAAELAKKAGDAAKGRDLAANVRARMVGYTRKGWKVEKDDKKRVKVVQGA
ncbi:MAG: hypothetical protein CO113_03280 [Elusimicrobia bacterium CG_4_9_14_3_um_filter_62_55]|nr:MAG: hypothetical protein COX66_12695 [Elusimicrobia bacterium CG_4_10_14_0_2_um_filter_63_34]PJB26478.1 MAG: hypothetical protein CO113_03280 [Elusimicrobia bacterium CG_4_9_14_3_um_filter_62_55]